MKLFIPVAVLCFVFANQGISQITISQTDMPQPGDTLRLSTSIDTIGLPPPPLTGAGITWNYSALVPLAQTIDTFVSVSSTPLAYQFFFNDVILYPKYKSTVAQKGINLPPLGPLTVSQVMNYYKAQASNYESVGYGANIDGLPTSVKDDTIDVVYNFPMNYGNSDSCHSSNHTKVPGLGYYGQFQYRVNHVEGWGTLITPFGTFQTLKVRTMLFSFDSLYVDTIIHIGFKTPQTLQVQYKWLANGKHAPVLQINETPPSKARQYIYVDSARHVSLGIAEVNSTLNNVSLYPNPAAQNTSVSYYLSKESAVNIAVYSVDGRCVSKVFNGQESVGNHSINMSVQNLQAGIYLLNIEANGEQTVKKLVVVK